VGDLTDASGSACSRLRLRFPGTCTSCGISSSPGTEAFWNRGTKEATCLACGPSTTPTTADTAGASAASEGKRRKAKRVEKVRRRFGDHAAVVADEIVGRETSETWGKGSAGESKLAAFVAQEVGDSVIALHDRLIPGTKGNIDHIFITSMGVWVVDAKAY